MTLPKFLTPYKERNFILLWLGQTISSLGDHFYDLALIWLIMGLTGSALLMGTVLTVSYIPTILLLVIGGAWADRVSPRKIMLWSDMLRALATLVLAILVTASVINITYVFIFAFFYGTVSAFFNPAASVLFPKTLPSEGYQAGLSLQRIGLEFVSLIGPPLAGLVVARYNLGLAFFFDAASFLVSVIALAWMRLKRSAEEVPAEAQRGFKVADLTAGWRFVWTQKGLLAFILLFALTNGLNNAEAVLVPLLTRNTLKFSAAQFGLLGTCMAIGTLSGAFIVGLIGARIRWRSLIICGSMTVFGLAVVAMGLATAAWHVYLAYFFFGLSFITTDIISGALWLSVIPEQLRGRVFSLLGTLAMSLNPLGFLLAGFLGSVYGVRAGLWIGGGAIAALGLLVLVYPPARHLDRYASKDAAEETNNADIPASIVSD